MGTTVRIDLDVRKDGLPGLDAVVIAAMQPATRDAMREAHAAAEDRVASQNIPGPGLSPATIQLEERELLARGLDPSNARRKWTFLERAVPLPTIHTRPLGRGAVADLLTPPKEGEDDRPIGLYHILEKGGVNNLGFIIPPRPLWRTVLTQDLGRILKAFIDRMDLELERKL